MDPVAAAALPSMLGPRNQRGAQPTESTHLTDASHSPVPSSTLGQHTFEGYFSRVVEAPGSSELGLEDFKHDPKMLSKGAPTDTARRQRSVERIRYLASPSLFSKHRFTVFGSRRLQAVVLLYLLISVALTGVYYFIAIDEEQEPDFLSGIKDFVDLCVTGIIFLLGGFVTTMLTRWWALRSNCVGALHQALSFLAMYAAAIWPSSADVDREARELVARYVQARGLRAGTGAR